MGGVFNERRVRTRKPHRCAYCGGEIATGTEGVLREWGIYDGTGFSRYACAACEPYIGRFWRWCDYECEDIAESWQYFMEQVSGEPYGAKIRYDRNGNVTHVICGNCWYLLPADLSRAPRLCPNCQCEVEGGGAG